MGSLGRLAWFPLEDKSERAEEPKVNAPSGKAVRPVAPARRSGLGRWSHHQAQEVCFLICKLGVMTPALPGPGIPASLKDHLMPWMPGFQPQSAGTYQLEPVLV